MVDEGMELTVTVICKTWEVFVWGFVVMLKMYVIYRNLDLYRNIKYFTISVRFLVLLIVLCVGCFKSL